MSPRTRVVLIALWPPVVIGLLVTARAGGAADGPGGAPLQSALNWLAGLGGAYLVSYAVAWATRRSWTAALIRSLLWAVVAFVCLSGIADMFAEHRDLLDRAFGTAAGEDPGLARVLRWRLACWAAGLGMAATCIGVGFEPRGEGRRAEPGPKPGPEDDRG